MQSLRRACLGTNGGVSHGVRFGNMSTSAAGLQPVTRLTRTLQSLQAFQVVNFSLFFFFCQFLFFFISSNLQTVPFFSASSFKCPRMQWELDGSSQESSQPVCPTWETTWAPWRTGWPCRGSFPLCCTASWTCTPSHSLTTPLCSVGTSWTWWPACWPAASTRRGLSSSSSLRWVHTGSWTSPRGH